MLVLVAFASCKERGRWKMQKEFVKKIEKITKTILVIGVIGIGIANLIFAFANDFWCLYINFFETGASFCFRVSLGCLIILLIIKVCHKFHKVIMKK